MSEPGDDGMCPALGWSGFKNLLKLSQVEMSMLEGFCLCPFPAGEQRVEVELPDLLRAAHGTQSHKNWNCGVIKPD